MHPAERFAAEANAFLEWVRNESATGGQLVRAAHIRLVQLYAAALALPEISVDRLADGSVELEFPQAEYDAIIAALPVFLFNSYHEVFNALELDRIETVTGDLSEDFAHIVHDLLSGMQLYNAGQWDEAIWTWWFQFYIHWGEHLTSALRALYWRDREFVCPSS